MLPIIEIKNISKKYNITHQRGGYVALRDVIMEHLKHPLRFIKGKAKKIIGKEVKEEFWALKNVDISINKGEAIGIIGANGAGKSTLLKILSKITPPTEGEAILRGKVASLLEVGTGFHPELTGRENIFLNGAILGMSRKEMAKKFNSIVEFAGVEKFLDTPVKHFSSGMYVRLAFSVAAHLEPDILIVDEVLAVGDAEFQKKCLGKMDQVINSDGRTILFVSHNLNAVEKLCEKTVLLEKGKVKMFGETTKVINEYIKDRTRTKEQFPLDLSNVRRHKGDGQLKMTSLDMKSDTGNIESGCNLTIEIGYEIQDGLKIKNPLIGIDCINSRGQDVFLLRNDSYPGSLPQLSGKGKIIVKIPHLPLNEELYNLDIQISSSGAVHDWIVSGLNFYVNPGDFYKTGQVSVLGVSNLVESSWKVEQKK